jgi:hypothetical protein
MPTEPTSNSSDAELADITASRFAVIDTQSTRHDSLSRRLKRTETSFVAGSALNDLLLLLATDRVGRTSQQVEFAADDARSVGRWAELGSGDLRDELVAEALAAWR